MIATREICNTCDETVTVGFTVPDEIWTEVVGNPNVCLCLRCFTRRADRRLIPWDREIVFWPVSLATHLEDPAPGWRHPKPKAT